MRFRLFLAIALALILSSQVTWAEVSFDPPRAWKRARTVQAGQQIWGFQTSYQKVSDRFTDKGKIQPLGQPYGRAVTWGQLLNNAATVQERAELEALMPPGAREDEVVANASYEVEREELGFRAEWAYGLMRSWMIGFDVPVVRRNTRVKSKVDVAARLAGNPNQSISQKIRLASEQELANSGFDDVPDEEQTWDWGDANLMSQVAVLNSYSWQWSLQQFVRFPTARNPDLDNYIQTQSDSGQVDLGAGSLIDYRYRRWVIGTQMGYVVQLPDTMRARVSSSSQARQVDPNVARDLGDVYYGALDVDHGFTNKLNVNLEYAYLRKFQDKFRGHSADGLDYATFGADTEQELHQSRLGVRYEIDSDGARAGVESKWVAGVAYTYPWIGRNSVDASKTSLDLISYF